MDDPAKRRSLEILRRANAALALYCQEHEAASFQVTNEELTDNRFVTSQLQAVQLLLDSDIHHCAEPAVQREIQHYRNHLLRVRELLQKAHRLTADQVEQLGSQHAHLDAARRWCEVFSEQF